MAGNVSDLVVVDFLSQLTGQATSVFTTTPLDHVYLGVATTTYSDVAAENTEAVGGGYMRVDCKGLWATPSGALPLTATNNAAVVFPTATGAWSAGAELKSFLLFTAATGGVLLGGGDLAESGLSVATGDTLSFASGTLSLNWKVKG